MKKKKYAVHCAANEINGLLQFHELHQCHLFFQFVLMMKHVPEYGYATLLKC